MKPTGIKDVELCVIPAYREAPAGLFDLTDVRSCLADFLDTWPSLLGGRIKGKPTGKYMQFLLPESLADQQGFKLDLFICSPETWGVNFTVRTGSAQFSSALAARWSAFGYTSKDARLHHRDGTVADTPEEESIFKLLRLEWVEPRDRHDGSALRSLK